MQYLHDRRASGVRRVPVERVVDVCGSTDPASAFQGRSVDVSGRGIQIRSVYLPELRSPVVVRFQERGSEVIAEGEVTWRKVRANGGDFGVRFTALDSASVQTLKALCGAEGVGLDEADGDGEGEVNLADLEGVVVREADHDTEPLQLAAGGVRLHIPGLATPMLAQVRGQGRQSVEVGSQLEFLRVGRSLEVEDLVRGGRRSAQIEAVDVMIDEHSRVPELLVSMRFANPSESPVPVAVRAAERATAERAVGRSLEVARSSGTSSSASSTKGGSTKGGSSTPVSERSRTASGTLRGAAPASLTSDVSPSGAVTTKSVAPPAVVLGGKAAAPSVRKFSELETEGSEDDEDGEAEQGVEDTARAKAAPSESANSTSSAVVGPTESSEEEAEPRSEADLLRERLDGMLGGVTLAARAASAQAMRIGDAASRGTGWLVARARRALARSEQAAAPRRRTTAAPRSGLRNNSIRQSTSASVQRRGAEETPAARRNSRAVVMGCVAALTTIGLLLATRRTALPVRPPAAAHVERAPLLPAPVVPAPPVSEPVRAVESAPIPALAASEPDLLRSGSSGSQSQVRGSAKPRSDEATESTAETARSGRPAALESSVASPSAPKASAPGASTDEFGQGRLTLPVIYRLRLDQPGGSLRGERTPTGFEVTIEGRRILDAPSSISDRDDRIAKIATHNGSQGTRMSFRFRRTIPGYKVRLRKDFVEILLSSS